MNFDTGCHLGGNLLICNENKPIEFRIETILTQNESCPIEISTKIWYNIAIEATESMRRRLDKAKWKVEHYADKRY